MNEIKHEMSNRDQETQARIRTQKSLKDAASLFKTLDKRFVDFFSQEKQHKTLHKKSLRRKFINQSILIDMFTKGRLIHKSIEKERRVRSKHFFTGWIFLERDEKNKFEYFEEQFFLVSQIIINTRKPTFVGRTILPIFIKRHQLERIAERLNKANLENILQPLSPYIKGLMYFEEECKKELENGKFIMLSNEAYVVVELVNKMNKYGVDSGYALTTILPKEIWSNRRKMLLNRWVSELSRGKKEVESVGREIGREIDREPIFVLKPSLINSSDRCSIDQNEMTKIYG